MNTTNQLPQSNAPGTDATIEVAQGRTVATRMYGHKKPGHASPLVVHFHGGAFVSGGLDNGCTVAGLLADAGAVVVSVAYPLAPEHPFPQPMEVGYAVLKWAHRQRSRLAGKGALVYVAGEEAGGNLAASVAMMARDQALPPLAGQILLSPMLDPCVGTASLREACGDATVCRWSDGWSKLLSGPHDSEHPYAVPAGARRLQGLAPLLVLVGDQDPMRDEALAYAARLKQAGLLVMEHVFTRVPQWPDALLEPGVNHCPCAVQMQEQFRLFFEASRCQEAS